MERAKSWTDLIDSQDDFSGGQLLNPYTKQWDLKLFNSTGSDYDVILEVVPDTTPQITITFSELSRSTIARLYGYLFISILPERSLPEALDSLNKIWEFYEEETSFRPAARMLPNKINAKVIGNDIRPELVVS